MVKKMRAFSLSTYRCSPLLFLILLMVFPAQGPCADLEDGEMLVNKLWSGLKEKNKEPIYKMIAPGFQSVHQKGVRDRSQEIEYLAELHIQNYVLDDLKITRNGPAILVSYQVSAEGTRQGKPISIKNRRRLSVFLKTESGWLWMAHANFGS